MNEEEIVEEILGFDLKVKTNKGIKRICFSDFKNIAKDSCVELVTDVFKSPSDLIKLTLACNGYSMVIKEDPNYPRLKTLHCNTDCHISDCKLYHSGENDKDKAIAIKTLAESPVPISDNTWWTGYCPRCGQLLQYHFHSPNDDGDHKQYCFKCGQLVDFGK